MNNHHTPLPPALPGGAAVQALAMVIAEAMESLVRAIKR